MISHFWIERRKPHWDRLQSLLERCDRDGLRSLTRRELRELSLLYRQIASDLSFVRHDPSGTHYARYLNQLLGRAHNIIYSARKTSVRGIFDFFVVTWPSLLRASKLYLAISLTVFLLCGVGGGLLTMKDPDFALQVLGPKMVETIERQEMWTHSIVSVKPLASSTIMTNNISVALTTFAMGITAGLGTLYMIAFNGLLLGVVGASCAMNGMSLKLWSFVVGHGSLELPAIIIAGAAGLRLASGMLFPGPLSRRESLRLAGAEAVKLELGTVPLLLVAGVIEGFFSPSDLPNWMKFVLGGSLFTGLIVWALYDGKATADSSVSIASTAEAQLPSVPAH